MQLRYEEDFVESIIALHVASRQTARLQLARFHHEREKLYRLLDADERNEAFFKFHLDWFREWALDKALMDAVREFPLLETAVTLLAFRKPRRRQDEGAELYVNDTGQRHAVIALDPQRVVCRSRREEALSSGHASRGQPNHAGSFKESTSDLTSFLRRELMHLHDMVDPAFEYDPHLDVGRLTPGQQRLAHERYRLLWDITIDGRLAAKHGADYSRRERQTEFDTTFACWREERRAHVFTSLRSEQHPTHPLLTELVREAGALQSVEANHPGAPCPLCGFPTFDWAEATQLNAAITAGITAEFPHWNPALGACGRCAEIYRVVAANNQREAVTI